MFIIDPYIISSAIVYISCMYCNSFIITGSRTLLIYIYIQAIYYDLTAVELIRVSHTQFVSRYKTGKQLIEFEGQPFNLANLNPFTSLANMLVYLQSTLVLQFCVELLNRIFTEQLCVGTVLRRYAYAIYEMVVRMILTEQRCIGYLLRSFTKYIYSLLHVRNAFAFYGIVKRIVLNEQHYVQYLLSRILTATRKIRVCLLIFMDWLCV